MLPAIINFFIYIFILFYIFFPLLTKDLEVTGVSRSGRVRKKSSKLMDFESPDEIETRYKRATPRKTSESQEGIMSPPRENRVHKTYVHTPKHEEYEIKQENLDIKEEIEDFEVSESDENYEEINSESMESSIDTEEEENQGFRRIDSRLDDHTESPGQSLYLMEKSNKKRLVIKDGKIIAKTKAQRKDKGKPRLTAYMLWAKEMRQDILSTNPDLDFAAISKRLGELWSTVPSQEKFMWRKRAKRENNKIETSNVPKMKNTGKINSKFINHKDDNEETNENLVSQVSPEVKKTTSDIAIYKVTGTQPVDVAAHLELLGESLRIIGERLKEHEVS